MARKILLFTTLCFILIYCSHHATFTDAIGSISSEDSSSDSSNDSSSDSSEDSSDDYEPPKIDNKKIVEEEDVEIDNKRIVEEEDEIGYIQSIDVITPPIASAKSSYQTIEVYRSEHFGKVLVIDDCLQLTERDSPHYNEMLAHVPMMEYLAHRGGDESLHEPIKALVLGGGDGYVVSELLKYSQVASIDHVELDEEVINVSKKYLPWADAWEDNKVNLLIRDGATFVKEQAESGRSYHVIVQDASDPFWLDDNGDVTTLPSNVLYTTSHFENLHKLLQPKDGVLMFQAETYNIPSNLDSIRKWKNMLEEMGFDKPRYGSIAISTYPTGQIGFFAAHTRESQGEESVCKSDACKATHEQIASLPNMGWNRIIAQFKELSGKTLYYHPRIHRSSFDLPQWVEEYLYGNHVGLSSACAP